MSSMAGLFGQCQLLLKVECGHSATRRRDARVEATSDLSGREWHLSNVFDGARRACARSTKSLLASALGPTSITVRLKIAARIH
jgi:hypothetical protein